VARSVAKNTSPTYVHNNGTHELNGRYREGGS